MTERAEQLLEQIEEQLAELDVPAERIETEMWYEGEADCTCGVCGEEFQFRETNIVDPDEFDYDGWDTEALHEFHRPFDQERICRRCEVKFVQNGGGFPNEKPSWDQSPED